MSQDQSVRFAFFSLETKHLVSMFVADYAQNRLYLLTTELKLNDGKENSQRIIHTNMNTSNFTRSWLNLYDILYRRANANATVFVFN